MLIKVCGITTTADAAMVLSAGADWIGLNLVGGPRRITLDALEQTVSGLDDPTHAVALVKAEAGRIDEDTLSVLRRSGVKRLQLYGDVDRDTIRRLAGDGFSSILVRHATDVASLDSIDEFVQRCGDGPPEFVLLDAGTPEQPGGTGRCLDWASLSEQRAGGRFDGWPLVILAGGLTATNVVEAIERVAPDGVDVASGVESSPGRKDHDKLVAFIRAVRSARP